MTILLWIWKSKAWIKLTFVKTKFRRSSTFMTKKATNWKLNLKSRCHTFRIWRKKSAQRSICQCIRFNCFLMVLFLKLFLKKLCVFLGKELGGDLISCPHLFNHGVEHEAVVILRRLTDQVPIQFITPNGSNAIESFWLTDSIAKLKQIVFAKFSIPVRNQKLMFSGECIDFF